MLFQWNPKVNCLLIGCDRWHKQLKNKQNKSCWSSWVRATKINRCCWRTFEGSREYKPISVTARVLSLSISFFLIPSWKLKFITCWVYICNMIQQHEDIGCPVSYNYMLLVVVWLSSSYAAVKSKYHWSNVTECIKNKTCYSKQ